MKIDYDAYDVYDPDYLVEHLGFVTGVLELLENFDDSSRCLESHIKDVIMEANNRVQDILKELHESVVAARDIEKKAIQGIGEKAK